MLDSYQPASTSPEGFVHISPEVLGGISLGAPDKVVGYNDTWHQQNLFLNMIHLIACLLGFLPTFLYIMALLKGDLARKEAVNMNVLVKLTMAQCLWGMW